MFKSVDGDLLYPVFQPIRDLNNRGLIGYEALLRHKGDIPPDIIFENVKKHGELFEVDTYSILLAVSTLSKTVEGYIFINIFPSTILHKKFLSFLERLYFLTEDCNYKVVFEINEQESSLWSERAFGHAINKIKRMGYLLAFDDVGAENVTIEDVTKFSPHFIKIDRSFSMNLSKHPEKQKALEKIIKQVNHPAKVILEGLETESDLLISKQMKIPLGQGYLLGRPDKMETTFVKEKVKV